MAGTWKVCRLLQFNYFPCLRYLVLPKALATRLKFGIGAMVVVSLIVLHSSSQRIPPAMDNCDRHSARILVVIRIEGEEVGVLRRLVSWRNAEQIIEAEIFSRVERCRSNMGTRP